MNTRTHAEAFPETLQTAKTEPQKPTVLTNFPFGGSVASRNGALASLQTECIQSNSGMEWNASQFGMPCLNLILASEFFLK